MEEYIYEMIGIAILILFPVWRIFKRAGLNPLFSLSMFIPFVGILASGLILSFSKWNIGIAASEDK